MGIENIPSKGRIVLAGNHTNDLDSIALISATKRTIHFLGKHTLFKGIKGCIFSSMGVIPVDRTKDRNREALELAISLLNDDKVVGIFPEGTINRTEEVLMKFKMGAIKMASVTNSHIVPFSITGKYRPFRKGLIIKFLTPYKVSSKNLDEENEKLMNKVSLALEREELI